MCGRDWSSDVCSSDLESWKAETKQAVRNCDMFTDTVKESFLATLDWQQDHACSRLYGLGMMTFF